jgi:hypothetical protein
LGAEGGAGFFFVEICEEGIVFAVVDAAGVETLGQDFGECGFADAQRAFDDNEAGGLRATLGLRGALRCGGFVGRHGLVGPREKTLQQLQEKLLQQARQSRVDGWDYSRVVLTFSDKTRRLVRGKRAVGKKREQGSRAPSAFEGAAMVCRKCENLFMSRASTGVPKCANEGFRGGYQLECDQRASADCPFGQYILRS